MAFGDSLIESVAKVVLGIIRRDDAIDYKARYGASIIFSDGNRATIRPDDARFGDSLSDCVVRRPEGLTIVPVAGTRCLLGWLGGDPTKRYVLLGADASGAADTWLVQTGVSTRIEAGSTATVAASSNVTFDTPETNAKHDLVSEHELGQSAGTLSAVVTPPATLSSVDGDDTAFKLTVNCTDSKAVFTDAIVTLGRPFASAPKCTVSATDATGSWVTGMVSANGASTDTVQVKWNGSPLKGPGDFSFTVFVRGNK